MCVALGGCALGDWLRAPVTSDDLVAAQELHQDAVEALAQARILADRLDADKAAELIAHAERAVDVAASAVDKVEADGTPRWLGLLGAAATIVAGLATGRAASIAGTLVRVVSGVQAARRALPTEQRKIVDSLLGSKQLKPDVDRIQAIKVKRELESATV
jgi:hypothetical protein